jgi:hypothetical protein
VVPAPGTGPWHPSTAPTGGRASSAPSQETRSKGRAGGLEPAQGHTAGVDDVARAHGDNDSGAALPTQDDIVSRLHTCASASSNERGCRTLGRCGSIAVPDAAVLSSVPALPSLHAAEPSPATPPTASPLPLLTPAAVPGISPRAAAPAPALTAVLRPTGVDDGGSASAEAFWKSLFRDRSHFRSSPWHCTLHSNSSA